MDEDILLKLTDTDLRVTPLVPAHTLVCKKPDLQSRRYVILKCMLYNFLHINFAFFH